MPCAQRRRGGIAPFGRGLAPLRPDDPSGLSGTDYLTHLTFIIRTRNSSLSMPYSCRLLVRSSFPSLQKSGRDSRMPLLLVCSPLFLLASDRVALTAARHERSNQEREREMKRRKVLLMWRFRPASFQQTRINCFFCPVALRVPCYCCLAPLQQRPVGNVPGTSSWHYGWARCHSSHELPRRSAAHCAVRLKPAMNVWQ